MEKFITPKIKICGLTKPKEAEYLNQGEVDFAGFVFYEKSKRNVDFKKAEEIGKKLSTKIKKVAVAVSPSVDFARAAVQAGFDVLQVHGELMPEILELGIPIWRAVNITDKTRLETVFLQEKNESENLLGYVLDGAGYGGGKPFDWQGMAEQVKKITAGKSLILAGGLTVENVQKGIRYFSPDVVDVSSGVEEEYGKSREKILEFAAQVRKNK
ncbi:MAG: phosphoribosylanthranilate isomerase [Roseburia sp.]|nr:phosphoribosylanthranilate isomerase [Roseburia sp.]